MPDRERELSAYLAQLGNNRQDEIEWGFAPADGGAWPESITWVAETIIWQHRPINPYFELLMDMAYIIQTDEGHPDRDLEVGRMMGMADLLDALILQHASHLLPDEGDGAEGQISRKAAARAVTGLLLDHAMRNPRPRRESGRD